MLKVGIVCGAGYVFGKEMMALELGDGLRLQGCDVEFVVSAWNNGDFIQRLKDLGLSARTMRLGFISATLNPDCLRMTADQMWRWPGLLMAYRRFLHEKRPDKMVHTNWHHLLLLRPFLDCKRDIFWLHEMVPDKSQYRRAFGWLAQNLKCFVPVSEAVAESLRRIGIPDRKIVMIHNGLKDPVTLTERKPEKRASLRVGIIGQVGVWKGHEDLLVAFTQIADKYPGAELNIFGSGTRAFEDKLRKQAAEQGIGNRIKWHGFVADRAAIYQQLDICVLPSRSPDPLPTVAIEAAFFGLPVVASRCGGLLEIVNDGETGLLFETGNPQALADSLAELLGSVELRRRFGAAARNRAEIYFSRERFVRDFLRLLDDRRPLLEKSAVEAVRA